MTKIKVANADLLSAINEIIALNDTESLTEINLQIIDSALNISVNIPAWVSEWNISILTIATQGGISSSNCSMGYAWVMYLKGTLDLGTTTVLEFDADGGVKIG